MKPHIFGGNRIKAFQHRSYNWGTSAPRHRACMHCGKAVGDDDLHWHALTGRCAECGLGLP